MSDRTKRIMHTAGLALAITAAVLAELAKDSRFGWAATALALVTNLRVAVAGKPSVG